MAELSMAKSAADLIVIDACSSLKLTKYLFGVFRRCSQQNTKYFNYLALMESLRYFNETRKVKISLKKKTNQTLKSR